MPAAEGRVAARAGLAAAGLAALAAIAISLGHSAATAPAFAPAARVAGVTGDWRLARGAALWDPPGYLYQKGYAHLVADPPDDATDDAASEDAAALLLRDRAIAARDLFRQSLALAPADAWVWADLARAQTVLGDAGAARRALARAQALAPASRGLCTERLGTVALLAAGGEIAWTAAERAGIAADLRAARHWRPRDLDQLLADWPDLARLVAGLPG